MFVPLWFVIITLVVVVLLCARMARLSGRVETMKKVLRNLEGFTGDEFEEGESTTGDAEGEG